MKNDSYFDRKDKNMPYTVPDAFFSQLESSLLAKTADLGQPLPVRHSTRRIIVRTLLAAAACILLVFTLHTAWTAATVTASDRVEQAFSELADEDQTYLLQTWQDDIFMTQQDNL